MCIARRYMTLAITNITRVITPGKRDGKGNVPDCGGQERFRWGNLKERDQLENLGVDGRII
jgi:hypothetical protein